MQEAFSRLSGSAQSILDLSDVTGLPDSTVHRILQSGVPGGAVDQIGRGRYRPGPALVKVAIHAMAHAPGAAKSQQLLADLHRRSGAAALLFSLAPLGGLRQLCADYAWGDLDPGALGAFAQPLTACSRSLRAGASGRVILAHLPAPLQELVFAEEVPPDAPPGAIRDRAALVSTLAEIRRDGYAVAREEVLPGWDAIAAPVMWGDIAIASVVLALPTIDMPDDLGELAALATRTATALSEHTGVAGTAARG
ncbi:IclR family transcriptional regulator [Kitasatospora sp. NPDC001574]